MSGNVQALCAISADINRVRSFVSAGSIRRAFSGLNQTIENLATFRPARPMNPSLTGDLRDIEGVLNEALAALNINSPSTDVFLEDALTRMGEAIRVERAAFPDAAVTR